MNREEGGRFAHSASIFYQMATALAWLHCGHAAEGFALQKRKGWTPILHRDIKPGNIFLVPSAARGEPPLAVLGDFGLATQREKTDLECGTRGYEPFENYWSPKGDIFSLGVTIYTLTDTWLPYMTPKTKEKRTTKQKPELRPSSFPLKPKGDLGHLLYSCLELRPSNRIDTERLYKEFLGWKDYQMTVSRASVSTPDVKTIATTRWDPALQTRIKNNKKRHDRMTRLEKEANVQSGCYYEDVNWREDADLLVIQPKHAATFPNMKSAPTKSARSDRGYPKSTPNPQPTRASTFPLSRSNNNTVEARSTPTIKGQEPSRFELRESSSSSSRNKHSSRSQHSSHRESRDRPSRSSRATDNSRANKPSYSTSSTSTLKPSSSRRTDGKKDLPPPVLSTGHTSSEETITSEDDSDDSGYRSKPSQRIEPMYMEARPSQTTIRRSEGGGRNRRGDERGGESRRRTRKSKGKGTGFFSRG